MRRPHLYSDKHDGDGRRSPPQGTSGPMARVRKFLGISSGGRRVSQPHSSSLLKSCGGSISPCSSNSLQLLRNFKREAGKIIGRPLDEIMMEQGDIHAHGVPAFIHTLCCHMITNGVDYETLLSDDWCPEETRSYLLEEENITSAERHLHLSDEGPRGVSLAAGLLRLFLMELPHPLLTRNVAASLFRILKDLFDQNTDVDELQNIEGRALRVRNLLRCRLPENNLRLLEYLVTFLNQLRNSDYVTCPISSSDLSRVLGRVLAEAALDDCLGEISSHRLAEVLLVNCDVIFSQPLTVPDEAEYNSDSVSSTGDSRSDNTDDDLFTPDEDETLSARRDEEDSSTTSDTDDFRSPPVSPLKESTWSPSIVRSTREITEVETIRNKLAPFGKDCIRSITDLLSSPDDSSRDEGTRFSSVEYNPWTQSGESSCVSEGDDSDADSEGDRDADGSDTEGGFGYKICPHEERRFSERFYPRNRKGSSSGGLRPRTRMRRKTSKDSILRVQSSEEEDRDSKSQLLNLCNDEEPHIFDPTPPDEGSLAFRDLLASNEPVTSDRASWGLKMCSTDNLHRTAPRYSRFEDDSTAQKNIWYRDIENAPNKTSSTYHKGPEEMSPRLPGQQAIKTLTKSISSIKKKIKRFEEQFEIDFGYRPSHSEKMKHKDIKKLVSELNKMRKELKQMKDDVAGLLFPKSFRSNDSTPQTHPETFETLRQVEDRLREKRLDARRPNDLLDMTVDQIQDEKTELQRALLYYESIHGRPSTRQDKDLARHLYDRYRQVKRSIVRSSSRTKDNLIELAPILEHVAMDFTLASPQHRGSLQGEEEIKEQEDLLRSTPINVDPHPDLLPLSPHVDSPRPSINLGDLHALPIHELKERKKEARDDKKRLRRTLRDYEEKFERDTGRKVQKEDRGPMEQAYMDYKHAKAKLRLLEALLSKHDTLKI